MKVIANFVIILTLAELSSFVDRTSALPQKCPGAKGKNCPKGQVCAKNGQSKEICGVADKTCSGKNVFDTTAKTKNGKVLIKCKAPGKGAQKPLPKGHHKDKNGLVYPTFCRTLPGPNKDWFNTNSEAVPCFKLTKAMIGWVKGEQDKEALTPIKCAWDYVLCFLFACYPGRDPQRTAPKAKSQGP